MRVTPAEVQQAYTRAGLEVTVRIGSEPASEYWGPYVTVIRNNWTYAGFCITEDGKLSLSPPAEDDKGLEDKLLAGTENLARGLALREITVSDVHNEGVDMLPLRGAQQAALLRNGYLFRPHNPESVARGDYAVCNGKPCIPGDWIRSLDATVRSASFKGLPEPYVNPKSPSKLSVALSRLVHRQ